MRFIIIYSSFADALDKYDKLYIEMRTNLWPIILCDASSTTGQYARNGDPILHILETKKKRVMDGFYNKSGSNRKRIRVFIRCIARSRY